jgi:death on curing protein
VRDYGLLEAAVARPQAAVFGQDAYPDLDAKAAALLRCSTRSPVVMLSSMATSGSHWRQSSPFTGSTDAASP